MRFFLLLVVGLAMLWADAAHAVTRTVTNLNDGGAGSLRDAIAVSAAGDAIVFATNLNGGTIALTTTELLINKNLTITGPGANLLTVARSNDGSTPFFRIFNITNGVVAISGLTISGGVPAPNPNSQGGGIRNAGTLTLTNCVVARNRAEGRPSTLFGDDGQGGGIFNAGTLKVSGCTLSNNLALGGSGSPSIRGGSADGGAIYNLGAATLANCTLANNIVGGGAGNTGPGSSGGDARGGGISNRGTVTLFNCTISANEARAAQACGSGAFGGGFYQIPASQNYTTQSSVASLRNTIIAGNIVADGSQQALGHDAFGAFNSQGFNLIGRFDFNSGWIANDKFGTFDAPLNPRLGILANNGGPTPTMALQPTSPAIDAGDDVVRFSPYNLATDQRGPGFPRKMGVHVDIGAYEFDSAVSGTSFVVTTTDDHDDGACGAVDCSLREAILAANTTSSANTITFKPGLAGTIALTLSELVVSDAVTIAGPGATVITVDGNLTSRVFRIEAPGLNVNISGLTINRGSVVGAAGGSAGQGGGIFNTANLRLTNCVLSNSTVKGGAGVTAIDGTNGSPGGAGQGAAIFSAGPLTLTGCTLSGNTATGGDGGQSAQYGNGGAGGAGQGGAIFGNSTLALNNCTVSGNRIFGGTGGTGDFNSGPGGAGQGAGVYSGGTLTLTACTLSGNTARGGTALYIGETAGEGGGVYRAGAGSHIVRNSIIAGNTAVTTAGKGQDAFGAFTSQGFNLIGKRDDSSGWVASDQTGTKAVPLNPRLGALANNGGPTPTMALLLNSPALDKGKSFGLTTDQRGAGFIRPADASALLNAVGGDGSDIGAFELQGPFLSVNDVSIGEGNSGTRSAAFTVSLSPAGGQTVTVKYFTSNGSATAGSDYVAASLTTLTFAPGETAKTVGVIVNGDTAVEANETLFLSLSTATNATLVDNQGRGTILNDDGPTLSIRDAAVTEGNSGTKTLNFAVQLSTVSTQTVTVKYATANGSATAGSDYVALPLTTISFAPGETSKAAGVTVNGDTAIEANETFFVNLSYATNATIFDDQAVGTISNDDGTVSASTKTNTNDSFSGIGAQSPVTSSTIISPESTSSASALSIEPAPSGTTEAQLITIVANASLSTLVLTFADTIPSTFTVTVNGEPVVGQTSVKGTSVTISLPQDILNSGDNVVVLWDNGMAEAVAS